MQLRIWRVIGQQNLIQIIMKRSRVIVDRGRWVISQIISNRGKISGRLAKERKLVIYEYTNNE